MRLAFALCRLDERSVIEPIRLRQHGGGDLDRVVERQRSDREGRRCVDRREAVGEQRLGGHFDVRNQTLEDVVKQRNLLVVVVDRTVKEEIGHAPQRLDPTCHGPVHKRSLQLVEQAFGRCGSFRTHCLRPEAYDGKGSALLMRLRPRALEA